MYTVLAIDVSKQKQGYRTSTIYDVRAVLQAVEKNRVYIVYFVEEISILIPISEQLYVV